MDGRKSGRPRSSPPATAPYRCLLRREHSYAYPFGPPRIARFAEFSGHAQGRTDKLLKVSHLIQLRNLCRLDELGEPRDF